MVDPKVLQNGAAAVIAVFLGLLIFDATSEVYEVPLPLYGTIGLIFGGGAVLGIKPKNKETPPKGGDTT